MRAGDQAMRIRVQRVYEAGSRKRGDGTRVLVDRLWPRGVRQGSLELDRWDRELAPSGALRTWYGHRPDRFEEFARRYRRELAEPEAKEALDELRRLADRRGLTLLTATRDVERSVAVLGYRVRTCSFRYASMCSRPIAATDVGILASARNAPRCMPD